jgi:hypothetical protein
MKFPLTIIFLLITSFLFAQQNLVPNPSFEEYTICPTGYYMLPTDWYTCSGDPDYFNECDSTNSFGVPTNGFGYQQASDGKGYCGFYAQNIYSNWFSYKEYLGCTLINSLEIGHKYFVSFRINFSEHPAIDMATNNIGLLFSTLSYKDYSPYDSIDGIPTNNFAHIVSTNIITDSQNWTVIRGTIIADSAYHYILIGNFFDVAHTDTVLLNNNYNYHKAYYFLDEVCVSEDSLTCNSPVAIIENNSKSNSINIFPNPTTNELTLDFTLTDNYFFELYNVVGAKRKAVTLDIGSQTKNIDLTDIDNGLYFYSVVDMNGNRIKTGKLIIIK